VVGVASAVRFAAGRLRSGPRAPRVAGPHPPPLAIGGQEDPAKLADLARKRLRNKLPELNLALEGRMTPHHRFMLRLLLDQLRQTEALIARLEEEIDRQIAPFSAAVELLMEMPGIDETAAHALIAEIGADMSRFPSAHHLASWAGMCPGNNESAGKRKSGRTNPANRWLKPLLVQIAWAASRTKGSYFQAQYHRLARRRGKKRALVAVGHSILVVVYHLLKTGECYEELGAEYFDQRDRERLTTSLVARLEGLGYTVAIEARPAAA